MSTAPHIDKTAAELRRHLADQLTADGWLRSPQWRAAVEAVPRHEFIPRFYRETDAPGLTTWEPITPELTGTAEWLRLAYSDESWMTQFDGHDIDWAEPKPISDAHPTSSSTLPSLVVRMLENLDVHDGMSVLEIGTGTGYSTALMCHRMGSENVTTIETDHAVAERASDALSRCGYSPSLLVKDGLNGYAGAVPYDRLIATCGVRNIPTAWVQQVRPGGIILTTLRGWMRSLGLVKLTVDGGRNARGKFSPDDPSFMIARQQDAPESLGLVPGPDDGDVRATAYGPDILTDPETAFMAQIAVPGGRFFAMPSDGTLSTFLLDSETDAFAVLTARRGRRLERPPGRPCPPVGRRAIGAHHMAQGRFPRTVGVRSDRNP